MATKAAVNPSVTMKLRTDSTALDDDMVRVPITVINGRDNTNLYNSPFTIGAWIRPDFDTEIKGGLKGIVLSVNNVESARSFAGGVTLSIDYKTRCLTFTGYSELQIPSNLGSTPIKNKEWQYIAMSFDPSKKKITAYINGEQELTVSYTEYEWHQGVSIKNLFFLFGSVGYNGAIDDIHIASKVLSQDQVKNIYDNNAEEVSLSGWYTLDEIVEGTTGQFANKIEKSNVKAQYVTCNLVSTTNYSYKKNTSTEAVPDLTSLTEESQRQISSAFNVTLPQASDFPGLKSLSFYDSNNNVLPQAETLSLDANSLIRIEAEAESGKYLRSISINGQIVENNGTFQVISDIQTTDFNFVISTIYSLEISAPEKLKYVVTSDSKTIEAPYLIPEGSQVEISLLNSIIFTDINMKLDGVPVALSANNTIPFTMPEHNTSFTFTGTEVETVKIYLQKHEGGTYTVSQNNQPITDGDFLAPGSQITVNATPDNGYYLLGIKANGDMVEGSFVTVPATDLFISADFRNNDNYNHALTFMDAPTIQCTQEDALEISAGAVGISDIQSLASANFAVGVWCRQTKRISEGNVILLVCTKPNYANTNPYIYFNTTSEGEIQFGGSFSKYTLQNTPVYSMNKVLPLNEWHHLTFNVDVSQKKVDLYFDGKLASVINNITVPDLTSSTEIFLYGGGLTFNGDFDDIQLFNRTLSAEEVASLYAEDYSNLESMTARFDFQNTSNNKGTFENLVTEFPEYKAIYTVAYGNSNGIDNGMSVSSYDESEANLTAVLPKSQRISHLQKHDSEINIEPNENGTIQTFLVENSGSRPLLAGEKMRNGFDMEIVATPEGDNILKSLKINGKEVLEGRAASSSYTHTVNGPTKIEALFAEPTSKIEIPNEDDINYNDSTENEGEYYTLTGIRVSKPVAPGIYIVKHNGKVIKKLVK